MLYFLFVLTAHVRNCSFDIFICKYTYMLMHISFALLLRVFFFVRLFESSVSFAAVQPFILAVKFSHFFISFFFAFKVVFGRFFYPLNLV